MLNPYLGESDKVLEAIDVWAQNAAEGQNPEAEELGRIVEELLQKETTYAEQNAKRFKLVGEAFQKDGFEKIIEIVDHVMIPFDKAMNQFLNRSNILKAIQFDDPNSHMSKSELKAESREFFLRWANGDFGQDIVNHLIQQLKSETLAAHCQTCQPSVLHTCFHMTVFAMSDVWRRFCLPAQTFPNRLFSLVGLDMERCEESIAELQRIQRHCPHCIDVGFSTPCLKQVDSRASIIELLGVKWVIESFKF